MSGQHQHSGAAPADAITLDAYAARNCPVKVQNANDRTITLPTPDQAPSESVHESFSGASELRRVAFAKLATAPIRVLDLSDRHEAGWRARVDATRAGIADEVDVIISPALPIDYAGHRRGSPDLLVRGADRAGGNAGYVPVQVKHHRVISHANDPEASELISDLMAPSPLQARDYPRLTLHSGIEGDLLQLAHYWRELEAAGWAAGGAPVGGLIGYQVLVRREAGGFYVTDPRTVPANPQIIWVELTEKSIRTFARTAQAGYRMHSPLDRYDHEQEFRIKVAEVAQRRTGAADDPTPMVVPIRVPECERCQWWTVCAPQLADADLSLRIQKSPLDVREVWTLQNLGIKSVSDLASANVDDLLPEYLPNVTHRPGAEQRLRLAAKRARMLAAGEELERTNPAPMNLAPGELEIDFDIETSRDGRIYLWGFLVDDPAGDAKPYYKSFARFANLSAGTEVGLAMEALTWLAGVLEAHPGTLIYHYSDFEPNHIRGFADMKSDAIQAVIAAIPDHFVDLFKVVRAHFFGVFGLGLKKVASAGAGFTWRDDDPGGLNSQFWFADLVASEDATERAGLQERILEYNEDDVRATYVLRRWLRSLDAET